MPLHKKDAELIKDTWHAIESSFDNIDWTPYAKNLLLITLEESKNHDRFRGDQKRGMSLQNEAKYFAIKRLWECFTDEYVPDVAEYVCIQKSCFMAYSIVKNTRFKDAWERISFRTNILDAMRLIASWDYCDLIR